MDIPAYICEQIADFFAAASAEMYPHVTSTGAPPGEYAIPDIDYIRLRSLTYDLHRPTLAAAASSEDLKQ